MGAAAKQSLILALGLCLVLSVGNGLCFQTPDIKISTNTSTLTVGEYSRIASDSQGHVYVVWQDMRNGKDDIYFNYSWDYGVTWQTNDIRINTTPAGTEYAHDPQIHCDEYGHVYVVWLDGRGISFNYSSDYGTNWLADDKRVKETIPGRVMRYPEMGCDSKGHIYVIWQEVCNCGIGRCGNWEIYFNYSLDYGVSWPAETIRLDTDFPQSGSSMRHKICCDDNGHVYVVWDNDLNGSRPDIYFNSSLDYGRHWQESNIRLDTDTAGRNSSLAPEISADANGHVYVVWADDRIGKIYFNYSSDYGQHWQVNDMPIGHVMGGEPKIASDANGHVYAVWRGNDKIYFNYSSDYGASWQPDDIRLDTDKNIASFNPEISCDRDGRVYVVWCNQFFDIPAQIHFNYSLNYGLTWRPADLRLDTNSSDFGVTSYPQITSDINGNVYVVWDDIRSGQYQYDVYFNYSRPPVLNDIGSREVNARELLEFTVTAVHPENKPLTFIHPLSSELPAGAVFTDRNNGSAAFSWTPDFTQAQASPYKIHFEVSDGSLSDVEDTEILINNALVFGTIYQKPCNEVIPLEGAMVSIVTIDKAQTLASAATDTQGKFSIISNSIADGNYVLQIAKNDYKFYSGIISLSSAQSFSFSVTLSAPVFGNMPENVLIKSKETYSLIISASDPNDDKLNFNALDLPAGAVFVDNQNGTADFNWTPAIGQTGSHTVIFAVTDGLFTANAQLNIKVENLNNPPALETIPDSSVYEGKQLQFKLKASDPDSTDILSFSSDNLPRGANLNSINGEFSWLPDFNQKGLYSIVFKVTDGRGGEDSKTTHIIVFNSSLYGKVVDRFTQKPISKAIIKVVKGRLTVAAAAADSYGNYVLPKDLPNGIYSVCLTVSGFVPQKKLIKITQGNTVKIDFYLRKIRDKFKPR